jgi:hypothetical protein
MLQEGRSGGPRIIFPTKSNPRRYLPPGHNILNICSPLWEILARRLDELLAWPSKKPPQPVQACWNVTPASSHTQGMNMHVLWRFAMCNEHEISPSCGGTLFSRKPSRSKFTAGSSNPRCLRGHTIILPILTQFSLNKK